MVKRLFVLLGLVFPLSLFAQKIELGFSSGIVYNSSSYFTLPDGSTFKGNELYSFSVNACMNLNSTWQSGINISFNKNNFGRYYQIGGEQIPDTIATETFNTITITPSFYINRKFKFLNSYLYLGSSAGLLCSEMDINTGSQSSTARSDKHFGYGYQLGLQIGYTHYFNKHIGANFEIAPSYCNVSYNKVLEMGTLNKYKEEGIVIPFIIGLRYRLGSIHSCSLGCLR